MGTLKFALAVFALAPFGPALGQVDRRTPVSPAARAAVDPRMRGDWSTYVAEASRRFDIPVAWIWRVVALESAGRTMLNGRPIRSPKGAMGLMQLMPDTWREMRAEYGLGSDPDDPHDNIIAGTAYLRRMYDRFGYPGMYSAYNAGPKRYAAYLAGRPLPAETINYQAAADGRGWVVAPTSAAATVGKAVRPRPAPSIFAVPPRAVDHRPNDPPAATGLVVIRRE